MRPRVKIWLEEEKSLVFGKGREALLQAIDETGSITKAAKKLKMSYRAAWGKIKATEERLGKNLVETHAGGKGGGGARLTREGKRMLLSYQCLRERMEKELKRGYRRFF